MYVQLVVSLDFLGAIHLGMQKAHVSEDNVIFKHSVSFVLLGLWYIRV